MTESIQQRINRLADGIDRQEIGALLIAMHNDQAALAASLNQLIDDHDNAVAPTTAKPVTISTKP